MYSRKFFSVLNLMSTKVRNLLFPPHQPGRRLSLIRPSCSCSQATAAIGRSAGRMGIFTLGKSSSVGTEEVPRRAYINQSAHPSHKSFYDNSMVRRGPPRAPHTWGAACVPQIARERDAVALTDGRGCYRSGALTIEILHPSLSPETARLRRRRRKRQSTSSSRSTGYSGWCRCHSTTSFPSSSRATSSPRCPTSTSCSSLRCRCAHLRYSRPHLHDSRPSAPAFLGAPPMTTVPTPRLCVRVLNPTCVTPVPTSVASSGIHLCLSALHTASTHAASLHSPLQQRRSWAPTLADRPSALTVALTPTQISTDLSPTGKYTTIAPLVAMICIRYTIVSSM